MTSFSSAKTNLLLFKETTPVLDIKESITKYKEKIDIYIIYKVSQLQKFFEQYKNRLNEIKDIWYSIMIELLFRYPIQCINYKEQIIQYLKGCIKLR